LIHKTKNWLQFFFVAKATTLKQTLNTEASFYIHDRLLTDITVTAGFWILMKQEMTGLQWHQPDHKQSICS